MDEHRREVTNMFAHPTHPEIMGEWVRADDTDNTLELAPTSRPGVIALRDTYDQDEMIFVTNKQILKLVEAVDKGRFTLF
jgi:hypothetical protein